MLQTLIMVSDSWSISDLDSRAVVQNLWVVTSLGVKQPFHGEGLHIWYSVYQVFALWFITVSTWQLWNSHDNRFTAGGFITTWGSVLRGCIIGRLRTTALGKPLVNLDISYTAFMLTAHRYLYSGVCYTQVNALLYLWDKGPLASLSEASLCIFWLQNALKRIIKDLSRNHLRAATKCRLSLPAR